MMIRHKIRMNSYEKHILNFNKEFGFQGLKAERLAGKPGQAKPDGLILVGMGGSGSVNSVFQSLAKMKGLRTPIVVWKNFGLPKTDWKKPFYVFVSFSGQTKETLSGLAELLGRNQKNNIAVVTTGGELKRLAEKNKIPLVTFPPQDLTPREALGKMYYGLLLVLLKKKIYPAQKVLTPIIKPAALKNQGQRIAKAIKNKIPLIYTDSEHDFLGYLWKTNFNETGKQPAFSNVLPELAHNEINIFENKKFPFCVILLIDQKQSKPLLKKIWALEKILKAERVLYLKIKLRGKTEEEKTWNAVVLSHFVGFYLAKLNKINPTEIRLIDRLKKLTK